MVRNEGSYIPPEKLQQVFNRFYTESRLKESSQASGTGIGLALTSELVNLVHGKIWVDSEKNSGTCFELEIPEMEISEPETISGRGEADTSAEKQVTGKVNEKSTVLVVEDNPDMRKFITSLLSKEFRVKEAADGNAGWDAAISDIPDIIISDIMMPGRDGTELCRELKNNQKTSHIPVILLSAKASEESRLKGLKALADDYILKPFHPDELVQRIRNQLDLRQKLKLKYSKDLIYQPSPLNINSVEERFFQKLNTIIEENISNDEFSVEELSQSVGMSRSQLHRKLNALAGVSASEYTRNYRLKRAHELLKNNAGSVSEIAYMTGFGSPAYFNRSFREYFGKTPGEILKTSQIN